MQQRPRWLSVLAAAGGCSVLAVSLAQPGPSQAPVAAAPQSHKPAATPARVLPFGLGSVPPQGQGPQAHVDAPNRVQAPLHPSALVPAAPSLVPPKAVAQAPSGPTQLIDLPRLDNRAIVELINSLVTQFEVTHDYAPADAAQNNLIAVPAAVVAVGPTLVRTDAQRRTLLLRFGHLRRPGQLPQLWARGVVAPDSASINPDSGLVEPAVTAILASREKSESEIPFINLSAQTINLAYIDADSAIAMLKAMGFNASAAERPLAGMGQMGGLNQGFGNGGGLGGLAGLGGLGGLGTGGFNSAQPFGFPGNSTTSGPTGPAGTGN